MGLFSKSPPVPTASVQRVSATLDRDTTGAPAVSLEKVTASGSPSLVKQFQKTGISLSKRGLAGIRARAVLVLDHSGSMHTDYHNGTVQQLVERALAFALNIDTDGQIEVILFDYHVHPTVTVDLNTYSGATSRLWKPREMGSTNLTGALETLKSMARDTTEPIFAIVVTDGSPDDHRSATKLIKELASFPVFIKFLAIRPVDYLQELDDLGVDASHIVDNVDAKYIGDPAGMADLAFAEAMTDEWDSWITNAATVGVLR